MYSGGSIMMSLANAAVGSNGTVAWNLADRRIFGDCQIDTGDEVSVIASYFGNVIVRVKGRKLAITRDAADRIKLAES